ncbi:GNAT family N-acetyltransferase [Nocardiopsis alba]|uniref:Acetyltransferase family protein n=1 Tax=Nocardiopsis alba (strain ATCC BAA-2165 / BE74) TaxID=1205910 RepID=J7L5W8_NOCAA|nr:GNAT family N-acetyltransferase [Nocardiopsis alba]AFR06159.1 acetyltransferase family protein [Nocardiopsis alba ATCC BAA-2165]
MGAAPPHHHRVQPADPQQIATTREIYTSAYESSSERQIKFTIYAVDGTEPVPVGTAMLLLDLGLDVAEYTVSIGVPEARGRGVGSEATLLVLDYAFHVTGLECVYLTVLEPNVGAITAYERAGFRRQGVRRNSNKWLGSRVDEIHMDAVPAEFPGPSRVKEQFEADS